MTKKVNKYLYGWNISVNYGFGHGWEVECFEEDYSEAKRTLRDYQNNCSYPSRMKRGRVPNPEYKGD